MEKFLNVAHRVWHFIRWPFWILLILYAILVAYRIYALGQEEKTAEVVAQIHAQRLTVDDVMGKNLPPKPDPALAGATLAGIDANGNGIRDDVELAIFEKYPNDAKIRAAELQYAMNLQNELANVFSEGTLVAVMQEEGRGHGCVYRTAPVTMEESEEVWVAQGRISDNRIAEVESLVFNTPGRKVKYEKNYEKYMTMYSSLVGEVCDVDSTTL